MPSTRVAPQDVQMSPSWYATQLGWAWPDGSGRSWQALLDLAERHYYQHRPARAVSR
jgi:hypothetical protein